MLWRLRNKLRLQDLAEMFLARGLTFSDEAVRDWEARCTPLLTERLRAKRCGQGGTKRHTDETDSKVNGRWCFLYRAIDREGKLVDARRSPTRDMDAAQRFFRQAHALAGVAPERVTTDGHDAYPRAIRETLGLGTRHRTSRYEHNRIAQDHRRVKQRHDPMRGFGSFASAARFCSAFAEQRHYSRAVTRSGEVVLPAARRPAFRERRVTIVTGVAAA